MEAIEDVCSPSETVSDGIEPIVFVRHESAKSLMREYWSFATPDIFEEPDMPCLGGSDEDPGATPNEMLAALTSAGFWGFAVVPKRTIHVWSTDACNRADLLALIAHEVGHCVGVKDPDEEKEEDRAHSYGFAAITAARFAGLL